MVDTIRTNRLMLRPLRPSDAGPITLYASDARLARMTTSIPHPYPPGAATAYIEGSLEGRRGEEVWAIDATPLGGEEMIGTVGYKATKGELGYWVGAPYWNAGYATEAVAAVVEHLFTIRELNELVACAFSDNAASAAVLAKAGFQETGTAAIYSVARGTDVPSRVFRLARADWSTDRGAAKAGGV